MTLTELRYIVVLAQEQHFGRAADRCHVAQPTLSVAVKRLEDELNTAIFERSKTRVHPTPVGQKIIAQAQRVLEQVNAIKDLASNSQDHLSEPLRLGAIFTVAPYLIPRMIPKLRSLAPQMPLYVDETFTATLRKRIRQGELDAIIVALPFTEPDVLTQVLYEEPFVVQMAADHPLARQTLIDPASLDDYNVLLLGKGHCFRDQVLEALPNLRDQTHNLQGLVHTAAEGSSLETLKHMVASGFGISVLPISAAKDHNPLLTTRPFAGNAPKRTVGLAWRASFPRHKAIDVLREAARSCADAITSF
jgi:LysR family transcriptional regulator, hydrogen peroxide-inducible genes activator